MPSASPAKERGISKFGLTDRVCSTTQDSGAEDPLAGATTHVPLKSLCGNIDDKEKVIGKQDTKAR